MSEKTENLRIGLHAITISIFKDDNFTYAKYYITKTAYNFTWRKLPIAIIG